MHHVHFIGIGGIGISALAQLYVRRGYRVSGTNDNPSPETLDRIRALGVAINDERSLEAVPGDVNLFIYSDAWVAREPAFMNGIRARGIPMMSYFEALGKQTERGTSIVITGTHGKTTTTAMVAKILIDAGRQPTVIAGSILTEYKNNYVGGSNYLYVIEGCEYQRHFLRLHPNILVINNIELDHTDYFRDLEDVQSAFFALTERVPKTGTIITNTDASSIKPLIVPCKKTVVPYQDVFVPHMHIPGEYNRMNARAAKTAALTFDPSIGEDAADRSLAAFSGVWRRFEYKGTTAKGALVYDDYAHHPTAIRNTLSMVREEFPGRELVVVFHPHLYSRTKQFFDEFARELSVADRVYLVPVYAAREQPDPDVTSDKLAYRVNEMGGTAHAMPDFGRVVEECGVYQNNTIILTMGAGDVYHVANTLVTSTV